MPVNQIVDIGYKIVEILRKNGYNLYGLDEVITSLEGVKNMYRFYVNIPIQKKMYYYVTFYVLP